MEFDFAKADNVNDHFFFPQLFFLHSKYDNFFTANSKGCGTFFDYFLSIFEYDSTLTHQLQLEKNDASIMFRLAFCCCFFSAARSDVLKS